jgi:hypothetical protein
LTMNCILQGGAIDSRRFLNNIPWVYLSVGLPIIRMTMKSINLVYLLGVSPKRKSLE